MLLIFNSLGVKSFIKEHISLIVFPLYVLVLLVLSYSAPLEERIPDPIKHTDFPEILARDTLNIILGYNSLNYFIYKGTPMGYQYEIVNNLTKDMGLKVKLTISNDLERAFQCVAFGSCDLVAMDLTIDKNRFPGVAFTDSLYSMSAVLIQQDSINNTEGYISRIEDLDEKNIHVSQKTYFIKQLHHLEDSLNIKMNIIEIPDLGTEDLIRMVATGLIDYTICDENLATINSMYYSQLDFSLKLCKALPIGWAVSSNAPLWLDSLNSWLSQFTKSYTFRFLKIKYFNNPLLAIGIEEDFHSLSGKKLSPFDKLIKKHAKNIDWDWRLLASLIYQESRFKDDFYSYAGAFGVMQLMPVTATKFGVYQNSSIDKQIEGGSKLLHYLDSSFSPFIQNDFERKKVVVAAYNLGEAHFYDAFAIANKYNRNISTWQDVLECLKCKSKPEFFNDPVVRFGYCNPWYVEIFVKEIFERFEHYKNIFPAD